MKATIEALDEQDAAIVEDRMAKLHAQAAPQVGEWVRTENGLTRVTYAWPDGYQTAHKQYGGRYYLGDGYCSYSGGLDPIIPAERFTRTDETLPAMVWIFHHDHWGAHRGVDVEVDMRVWELA